MRKACLVLMAVCIGLALIALAGVEAQAASIKLTYSNFSPPPTFRVSWSIPGVNRWKPGPKEESA